MNPIPDSVLKRLEQLARVGEAISTAQAREVLGLSMQQFHRLGRQADFPKWQHIGRNYWMNPQRLLDFVLRWNRLVKGLTLPQVAELIHCTVYTARAHARRSDFPAPLGEINGRERWDESEIRAWHAARVDGTKLPAHADIGARVQRKKKALAKVTHHGKRQREKASAAA